jgi:GAF domain-containing protein
MKCPRCQQENLSHAEFCLKCGTPVNGLAPIPKSYADIKHENERLTSENDGLRSSLHEAIEQQTATSEILRVISDSRTDAQPVFDVIVRNAARLCDAVFSGVALRDGDQLTLPAAHGLNAADLKTFLTSFPIPLGPDTVSGRAILEGRVVHVRDQAAEPAYARSPGQRVGTRSIVTVPMLRNGRSIGAISAFRREVRPFTDKQIALVQTFADQAVIAIENVRLLKELEARNRDLTDALEQQTATAEILRVISQSQTDVQPVFDTIVRNAVRLCGASHGGVYRFDGELVHSVAHDGYTPEQLEHWRRQWPRPVTAAGVASRAITTRGPVRIGDVETAGELHGITPEVLVNLRARGARSVMTVPMFRKHEVIGAISLAHRDVDAFSDAHVELLKTFADQAVIAIENVRLFRELEARTHDLTRSVGELRALGEIGQAISSTLDLQTVLGTIVARATQLSGTDAGVIYEYDEHREIFVPRATEHLEADIVETMLATPVRKGEGATGRLAEVQEPIQFPDILEAPAESRVRGVLVRASYRALLAVPLLCEGQLTPIRK